MSLWSDNFVDAINFSVWEESEFLNHPTALPTPHTFRRPCSGACSTFHGKARCCCFHEQMVLNFGIKLCYMLTHLDSYPVLTYLVSVWVKQTDMAPSLASIDSIFRFLFTIGFSFQPRAFPPSLELTLEKVISSRFVKLIPFIQQVYQRSYR